MKINWKLIAAILGVIYLLMVSISGGALSFMLIYYLLYEDAVVNTFTMLIAYGLSCICFYLSVRACIKFELKE